jgi:3-hydroxybutyrate dehydrogenase
MTPMVLYLGFLSNICVILHSFLKSGMKRKTVLITGGTSGIGLGIAACFAKAGYNLVLNGLEINGEEITNNISQQYQVDALFVNADISNSEAVEAMCKLALERFGTIEILINNAGIQHVSAVEKFPIEKWNAIININLNAAFYTTRYLW